MAKKLKNMSDSNLLLLITIVVFVLMYAGAIMFQGKGFLKPQTFFNILNANAALIILSCGLSLVMMMFIILSMAMLGKLDKDGEGSLI